MMPSCRIALCLSDLNETVFPDIDSFVQIYRAAIHTSLLAIAVFKEDGVRRQMPMRAKINKSRYWRLPCVPLNTKPQQLPVSETCMNPKQIEEEALHLSEEERAKLAQKLLLSLDAPSEAEISEDWLIEAHRRARELDEGLVQPISAEEVRRKAQALLR